MWQVAGKVLVILVSAHAFISCGQSGPVLGRLFAVSLRYDPRFLERPSLKSSKEEI